MKQSNELVSISRTEYVRMLETTWILEHLLYPALNREANRLLVLCQAAIHDQGDQYADDCMHLLAQIYMLTERQQSNKELLLVLITHFIEGNNFWKIRDIRHPPTLPEHFVNLDMDVWRFLLNEDDNHNE